MSTPSQKPWRVGFDSVEMPVDVDSIRRDFIEKLYCQQGKFQAVATTTDHYMALAYVVRDRLLHRWIRTAQTYFEKESRTVAYLSAEFLLGQQLGNNLLSLGLTDVARQALSPLGISVDALVAHEEEPGLGNGGLGRLAACFMDSLATLDIPAIGYGIRYEYGIFDQLIRNGEQVEIADKWLRHGNPWELPRREVRHPVGLGGHTEHRMDGNGRLRVRWVPERWVLGIPYDTPVLGYQTENANFLRLWRAAPTESFDFQAFNVGDYYRAVEENTRSETISKVLYPNDAAIAGKRLRLEQQYFLVACSLRDMIRIQLQRTHTIDGFHEKYAVQLNDTHPALAIPELMRLLVDEHELGWERAWEITLSTFGYTNHTLLPEALETWSLPLFASLFPRHLEIIFEINRRFLADVRSRFPTDTDRVRRCSLIDETGEKSVRMAHLACVGSHSINGVAELHSRLLVDTVLHDFAELYPERFTNVTNGITPRRFIALSNPPLSELLTEAVGPGWMKDLGELQRLEPFAGDPGFRERFRQAKRANKDALAAYTKSAIGIEMDPSSLYDVQVKRMHEYKRQHLNLLHVITQYLRIHAGAEPKEPRTFVFAGKAAPGYFMAKLVIRLIHGVADVLRRDPKVKRHLNVVFVPDFNVTVAQRIYPAADLSEQISTAGKEASGTGNMKLSVNGALTIGTLDGANVEIRERVGHDNFFLFGLDTAGVRATKAAGYRPAELLEKDPELRSVIELVASGHFADGDRDRFAPLVKSLLEHDDYLVLADYRAYLEAQAAVSAAWQNTEDWTRRCILTVARMGYFSSDRSIREYCRSVWRTSPVPIARTSADES